MDEYDTSSWGQKVEHYGGNRGVCVGPLTGSGIEPRVGDEEGPLLHADAKHVLHCFKTGCLLVSPLFQPLSEHSRTHSVAEVIEISFCGVCGVVEPSWRCFATLERTAIM